MTHVQSFDSIEDAIEHMAQQTDKANAALHPVQQTLTYGNHWVRFYPEGGFLIFGYIHTLDEGEALEKKHGADDEEAAFYRASAEENHERGYMAGYAYSIVEPEGEPGDTHRFNAWPISLETFEAARAAGWNLDKIDEVNPRAYREIANIHKSWTEWQRVSGGI